MPTKKTVSTHPELMLLTEFFPAKIEAFAHKFGNVRVLGWKNTGADDQKYIRTKKRFDAGGYVTARERITLEVIAKANGENFTDIWEYIVAEYPDHVFRVQELNTINMDGKRCKWTKHRDQGLKVDKLVLTSIDGISHEKLSTRVLASAADGMYFDGCIFVPRKYSPGYMCGNVPD